MMRAWFEFVLRRRWLVLGAVLVITLLALIPISQAVVASSIVRLFLGESPEYAAYEARARRFANDEFFLVVYEDPEPLSAPSLDRLGRTVARIRAIPEIGRVLSLQDAVSIRFKNGLPRLERHADIDRLRKDPLYGGLLISEDGKSGVVHVELKVDPDRSAERAPEIVREVIAVFEEEGFDPDTLHRGGLLPLLGEIMDQTHYNIRTLFPAVAVVLIAVVLLLFRRLAPVVVSTAVSLLAVFWCVGFATLLDSHVSVLISVVPAVVLVVAFSDVVHL